jgi:uncharacterized RDD family membrane protein YckC
MNCWQILDIDKGADLTDIKHAYAAKLKHNKPDENPEGFKRLHAAYKQASRFAKTNPHSATSHKPHITADNQSVQSLAEAATLDTTEPPEQPHIDEITNPLAIKTLDRSQTVPHQQSIENEPFQDELEEIARTDKTEVFIKRQSEWRDLTQHVDEVTAHMATMNFLAAWKFLNQRDSLLDIQFKSELSYYIFNKVATRLLDSGKKSTLNQAVFVFLDNMFRWQDRRDLLEDDFGYEAVDAVLQSIPKERLRIKWYCPKIHRGKMLPVGYFIRIYAAVFDWFLLVSLLNLLADIGLSISPSTGIGDLGNLILASISYIILAPIMEATPLQGTLGKILLGIKVVSSKGRRLNILHALLRAVMFTFSSVAIKITVWINLIQGGERLLHDRMSGSMVIRR